VEPWRREWRSAGSAGNNTMHLRHSDLENLSISQYDSDLENLSINMNRTLRTYQSI